MKQRKAAPIVIWLALIAVLIALTLLAAPPEGQLAAEGGLFRRAGPALFAGMIVVAALLIAMALIRVLAVPRFTAAIPGRFQLFLEQIVCMVDGLGRGFAKFGRGIAGAVSALIRGIRNLGKKRTAPAQTAGGAAAAKPVREPMTRQTKRALAGWLAVIAVLFVLSVLAGHGGHSSDVQAAMRDAVLHDANRVALLGLEVNPGLIAAIVVMAVLLLAAALIRVFAIPRFKTIPGRFQLLLETAVDTLDGLAQARDKRGVTFVGAYVFAAGAYIFVGTLFELLGLQAIAANGASVTLPAPLSDVNAAICMGCLSYLVILGGGIIHAGAHGAGAALKEFSLPISMSFRLFGALLSGLLVTDLVYHYIALSYVLPVVIGVIFTLLHALIQTYVLCMLVGMYYGEVTERPEPKQKKTPKRQKTKTVPA